MKSLLTKSQKLKFTKIIDDNTPVKFIAVTIRYDDECNNGHNSFSITGTTYTSATNLVTDNVITWGSIHEEIVKYFPELQKYIKWHSFNSNGPLYYTANTLYHSRDREDMSLPLGVPLYTDRCFNYYLSVDNFPVTFETGKILGWLKGLTAQEIQELEIIEIPYAGKNNPTARPYAPGYSFTGYNCSWGDAPFTEMYKAVEFLEMLKSTNWEIKKRYTSFNTTITPNLSAARASAIWPGATLEELQDETKLLNRLPGLIAKFKSDIEELGLVF